MLKSPINRALHYNTLQPLIFRICPKGWLPLAGAVSPNKRKILLKTLEQLVVHS